MSLVGTSSSGPLPPELLGNIFEYISQEHDSRTQLEDLLLVCRTWKNVALAYRALWGQIWIIVGHKRGFSSCIARVKSRLSRSGTTTPLFINIAVSMARSRLRFGCYCIRENLCLISDANDLAIHLLGMIAGSKGENCHRWQVLEVGLMDDPRNPTQAHKFNILSASLVYPTPSLLSLTLRNINFEGQVLPSCPFLQDVHLIDATFKYPPDISNILHFDFCWYRENQNLGPLDFSSLETATNLQELKLEFLAETSIIIPKSLPSLSHLIIEGHPLPSELFRIKFPALKKLTIEFNESWIIGRILEWEKDAFSTLQYLDMTWAGYNYDDGQQLYELTTTLLCRMDDITTFYVDEIFFEIIFRLIWETRSDLESGMLHGSDLRIKFIGKKRKVYRLAHEVSITFSGDENVDTLNKMAKTFGVALEVPWENSFREYGS